MLIKDSTISVVSGHNQKLVEGMCHFQCYLVFNNARTIMFKEVNTNWSTKLQ